MELVVRQAIEADIPKIRQFIKENWNENHIFVQSEKFFRYMLCNERGVNVIIAMDEKNNIYGMEGCTFYNSSETPDSSGMMWRCLKTSDVMLGIDIDKFMQTYQNQRFHFGVGCNPDTTLKITKKLYKHLVGKMDHFYRLNPEISQYRIAKVGAVNILDGHSTDKSLKKIKSENELRNVLTDEVLKKYIPYKDINYIVHRYINHPTYEYDIYGIDNGSDMDAVLITRTVEYENSTAIKIIDYIGDSSEISGLAKAFDELMIKQNSEYIDIYSVGISEEELNSAGLIRLECNDSNIIPNYFEPFLQQNVDIYYTAPYLEGVKLFRGDADQDRPNVYKEK